MFVQILRRSQIGFGNRKILLQGLQLLLEGTFFVFANADLCDGDVVLRGRVRGQCPLVRDLLLIDAVLDRRRIQPHEFVTRLHRRTGFDDPQHRAAAADLAFDFGVAGAFQSSLFDDCDGQVPLSDRVSQPRAGLLGIHAAQDERRRSRQQADQTDAHQHAWPQHAAPLAARCRGAGCGGERLIGSCIGRGCLRSADRVERHVDSPRR